MDNRPANMEAFSRALFQKQPSSVSDLAVREQSVVVTVPPQTTWKIALSRLRELPENLLTTCVGAAAAAIVLTIMAAVV